MQIDFIKSGAANESDRPEAIKLFCNYIDDYILEKVKTEKQMSSEDVATLAKKLNQIKNQRDYAFTDENLTCLNRLRTQATTVDDRWKPMRKFYWRSEYPVFDKKKSDSPSVMVDALYVSRFLLKEFISSLV